MKKAIALCTLLAVTSAGCLSWNSFGTTTPVPPPPVAAPPRPAAPVTVDQVNSGNASQMADTLQKELDRESHQ